MEERARAPVEERPCAESTIGGLGIKQKLQACGYGDSVNSDYEVKLCTFQKRLEVFVREEKPNTTDGRKGEGATSTIRIGGRGQ